MVEAIEIPVLFVLLFEGVFFYVDTLVAKRNWDWRMVAVLITAVISTALFRIDLFADAGFVTSVPFVGSVFTGILFSRGANVGHDVFDWVKSLTSK